MITTSDGVVYRKMQAHLKPYTPQNKKSQAVQCVSQLMAQSDYMWSVKQPMAQSDHKKSTQVNNQSQVHISRLKGTLSPQSSVIYKYCMFTLCIWIYIVYCVKLTMQ